MDVAVGAGVGNHLLGGIVYWHDAPSVLLVRSPFSESDLTSNIAWSEFRPSVQVSSKKKPLSLDRISTLVDPEFVR